MRQLAYLCAICAAFAACSDSMTDNCEISSDVETCKYLTTDMGYYGDGSCRCGRSYYCNDGLVYGYSVTHLTFGGREITGISCFRETLGGRTSEGGELDPADGPSCTDSTPDQIWAWFEAQGFCPWGDMP